MNPRSSTGTRLWGLTSLLLLLTPAVQAITLDECIHHAMEDHPGVQAAAYRVEAAREAIGKARSAWYPILSTEAAYARTDNPPQAFSMILNQRALSLESDFNNPDDTENLDLALKLAFPLYTGGVRGLDRELAMHGESTAAWRKDAVLNELIHQVTWGYYSVLQAQALVQVQADTVRSLEESLRVATERYQAGSVVQTDVLNLDVRLAEARENLIRAGNAVALATASLNTAIGSDLVTSAALSPEPIRDVSPPPELPDPELPDPEIEARPELRAAETSAAMREISWKKTRRSYAPRVDLVGALDWNSDVSTEFENSYLVGVAARWDLFTGFRRGAADQEARRMWQATLAEMEALRNQLLLDLRRAHLEATDAYQRLEVSRKSVASAQEALRITQERYENGAADVTELLTAQVGLTATRSRSVSAFYDYLIALSNIDRAHGRLVARYAEDPAPSASTGD